MDEFLKPNANYLRLLNEYRKYGSLTIAFDFDGTVHDYHKTGQTYYQMIELLKQLKEIGCKVVCWTAYKDLNYVKEYCDDNGIPCDGINEGGIPLPWESKKPFFSALLDDRAGLESMYRDLHLLVKTIQNDNQTSSKIPTT